MEEKSFYNLVTSMPLASLLPPTSAMTASPMADEIGDDRIFCQGLRWGSTSRRTKRTPPLLSPPATVNKLWLSCRTNRAKATVVRSNGGQEEKRGCGRKRKLLRGEKVEVLSLEEGLVGSWHEATVVRSQRGWRFVEYANLVDDADQSRLAAEWISVSECVEATSSVARKGCRSEIRPLPPPCEPVHLALGLRYGLCVDVLENEAWWEGVVFDHDEQGSSNKERLVFFPDQGDQQVIPVDRLRLTQDWDEVSGHWKPRGDWLLLRALEDIDLKEDELPVSIRQIWYDLTFTEAFAKEIHVWCSGSLDVWRNVVHRFIQELLTAVNRFTGPMNHEFSMVKELTDDSIHSSSRPISQVAAGSSSPDDVPEAKACANGDGSTTSGKGICMSMTQKNAYQGPEPKCLPDSIAKYVDYIESEKGTKHKPSTSAKCCRLLMSNARRHLLYMGWRFWMKDQKGRQELRYRSPCGKNYISLHTACKAFLLEVGDTSVSLATISPDQRHSAPKSLIPSHDSKKRKGQACIGQAHKKRKGQAHETRRHDDSISHRTRSNNKSRQAMAPSLNLHSSKTVLSWLIDKEVILPRERVTYICKEDGRPVKKGRVTREGIKCWCCEKVFSLTKFGAHAGNTTDRPAANILLSDGKSLLQRQMEAVLPSKPKEFPRSRMKKNCSHYMNDSICSICQDGGDLLLCDNCPSSFHRACVGLEDVPEGEWCCPSCQCGICGSSEFHPADTGQFTEKTVLWCDQCEREYHVGCLRERGSSQLTSCPTGNWFCNEKCHKIFNHLRKLLGKRNATPVNGLSWTLLRSSREKGDDFDGFNDETTAEHHSKLYIALDVLHECFETIIESRTRSDVVADVLFNRVSELNRLNFWGFYTMVLQRGDELIAAATFRVYGEKIAELPLIGTRFQYRRQGMCRVLVNELEKLLSTLGVERLLLPAIPEVLQTWMGSFGFTQMTSSEILEVSQYTLLNFLGTVMCQKALRIMEPRGHHNKLTDRSSVESIQQTNGVDTIISSQVVEIVKPVKESPQFGEAFLLPCNANVRKDSSHQSDAAHRLSSSSFINGVGQAEDEMINHTSACPSPGKCGNDTVLVQISHSVAAIKPAHPLDYRFSGKCYKGIGNASTGSRHLFKGIDISSYAGLKQAFV